MDFYGQKVGYVRSRTTERIVTWDLICVCGEFPFFPPFFSSSESTTACIQAIRTKPHQIQKKSKNVFPEISSFFAGIFDVPDFLWSFLDFYSIF